MSSDDARVARSTGPLSVVVAVPTFRRPDQLRALLPQLIDQLAGLQPRHEQSSVLVIDNDLQQSAGPVVDRLPAGSPVRYLVEPQPGVVAVRNRALDEASGADLCVFIDDDECPEPRWLQHLVDAYRRCGAPGVAGPVRSVLPDDADPWIVAGGFFARRHRLGLPTGSPIPEAASNNLLLEVAAVRAHRLRFDARFALAGGEDSLFTRQLSAAAGPLHWCAEAVVSEVVPAGRLSRGWVRRRAVSLANSEPLVRLALTDSRPARTLLRLRSLARGLARVAAGVGGVLAGVATGSLARRARGARTLCRGVGLTAGALDLVYQEYRRDGRRWVRSKNAG